MEFFKKFLSRKFLAALGVFGLNVFVAIYGEGETSQLIAQVGAVLTAVIYMLTEAWLDNKALSLKTAVPTVADALYDLISIYEEKNGANGVSDLVQEMAMIIKKFFVDEQAPVPVPTGNTGPADLPVQEEK